MVSQGTSNREAEEDVDVQETVAVGEDIETNDNELSAENERLERRAVNCPNIGDGNGNMSTFLDTIPAVYQNETNNNRDGLDLNDREINNNLAIGTPLQDHPMPGFQNSRSFQYYVPPPQYCPHDQVCPQSSQTPNHYVDATVPCSCPNPQSSYYPIPPPDYQELSPNNLSPLSQGCPPPLQNKIFNSSLLPKTRESQLKKCIVG